MFVGFYLLISSFVRISNQTCVAFGSQPGKQHGHQVATELEVATTSLVRKARPEIWKLKAAPRSAQDIDGLSVGYSIKLEKIRVFDEFCFLWKSSPSPSEA